MIRATIISGEPSLEGSVNGIAIFLDNWAIKTLAKSDPGLGERFIAAVHKGADVLFSMNNAIEALGPQGNSSDAFKAFLNRLGPHWYPMTANYLRVIEREDKGLSPSECGYDGEMLVAYFQSNTANDAPGSGAVIDLSADRFFKLGNIIEFSADSRDHFVEQSADFDRTMKDYVIKLRAKYKKSPAWLDKALPSVPFHPSHAAKFAFVHLMRELITDRGYQIEKGDAMDMGNAVIASAFSSFATLDKQWKRRVENLPQPNRNPRVYSQQELGTMIADIEAELSRLNA
jgi:hypothetical protein